MAKDQSDFFKVKKPWSEVKDDLLAFYLVPYFQKVLATLRPVRYIDCFAGRGSFDDGKLGSPLIALDAARKSIGQAKVDNTNLALTFIESRWSSELEAAATKHEQHRQPPPVPYAVVSGRFERDTQRLISTMTGQNIFLYIDPYGIRDLDHGLIMSFADPGLKLYSIELLINLNSFGFFRAGCRALKVRYQDDVAFAADDDFTDPIEQAVEQSPKPVALLSAIAGGDYWKAVVEAYNRGDIDGYGAERQFSDLYRRKLGETYRYVLSMPIRLQERQQPKYRMVYATNHSAGCILMADNMMKRTDNLSIRIESYAQATLFPQGVDGDAADPEDVQRQVKEMTDRLTAFTDADEIVADFFVQQGVVCKSDVVRQALARLEKLEHIEVRRDPPTTATGKPSTFFTTSKKQKVAVRAKSTSRART